MTGRNNEEKKISELKKASANKMAKIKHKITHKLNENTKKWFTWYKDLILDLTDKIIKTKHKIK